MLAADFIGKWRSADPASSRMASAALFGLEDICIEIGGLKRLSFFDADF
jgi:hypothetical protein